MQTFVSKVISLLFNMLSRFVINFSSKEQASFNFVAAITICSDLGFPDSSAGKNLPVMQETSVRFLGQEDSLEKA